MNTTYCSIEGKKTKRVRGRLVYSEEIVYSEGETDVTFLHDIYTSFTCIPHLFQICVVQYGKGEKKERKSFLRRDTRETN